MQNPRSPIYMGISINIPILSSLAASAHGEWIRYSAACSAACSVARSAAALGPISSHFRGRFCGSRFKAAHLDRSRIGAVLNRQRFQVM